MDNRTIAEKADLAVSDLVSNGGYLNTEQSNEFIRILIEQPTILNSMRVVPMNSPKMEINKIGFTSRILKVAPTSGVALAASDRSKPATEKVELNTKELIAEIHIPYDVLEDNIERGRLEDTIMSLIAERASLDLEELAILGHTGSADTYLATTNGILNLSSSHIVDFTATLPQMSKDLFKSGKKAMPNPYLRNLNNLRFWVSPDAETEYADSLANRETVLGDSKVITASPNYAYGIRVVPAALMPNTKAIFTWPQNMILGIQRQVQIETDRDIRARVLVVVLTMRIDIQFEEEDGVVKMIGLNPNGDATTTTTAP